VDDGLPRAAAVEAQRVTETAATPAKAPTVTWSPQTEEEVVADSRAAMKLSLLGGTRTAPDSFQAGRELLQGRNATGELKNGLVELLAGLGLGHYAGALEKVGPPLLWGCRSAKTSGRFSES
jgi:hypothetical protein